MPNLDPSFTYTQPLTQTGLTLEQAQIYEILLKTGPATARKISQSSTLKRTLVYKILEDLGKLGLVTRRDEVGKVSVFEPAHPLKLKELVEQKAKSAQNALGTLDQILGQLTSDFNLVSGRPGVRFFEGREGVQKVADDSLTAKTEILSYIDNEAVNKYLPDLNREYVKKRNALAIKKRMITIDSEYIRHRQKDYNFDTTDIRVISARYPFATVMQIYDHKLSYITLDETKMIGIIIEDPHISQMHRTLFEYMWATAAPLVRTTLASIPTPPSAPAPA